MALFLCLTTAAAGDDEGRNCQTSCSLFWKVPSKHPPYDLPTSSREDDVSDFLTDSLPHQCAVPEVNPCPELLIESGFLPTRGGAAGSRLGADPAGTGTKP